MNRQKKHQLVDALHNMVRILRKTGGFMRAEDQQVYRAARDLLRQHGRNPEE